ncbi:MAG: hypothetical protein QXF01_01615 [Candidatus Micrarchaeaceae archaeon]
MHGIILNSRRPGLDGISRYVLFDLEGKTVIEARSSLELRPGEVVNSGRSGTIDTARIEPGNFAIEILKRNAGEIAGLTNAKPYATGNANIDCITEKAWKKLKQCGALLLTKLAMASPVIIRFHNDADGSSGAYALYRSIYKFMDKHGCLRYKPGIHWIMQKGVSYSLSDANEDLMLASSCSSLDKPLIILIDFGTSPESNAGIERIQKSFDIIWLDHHPIAKGFKWATLNGYVNPWLFGGDSDYTAGFLACSFSKTFADAETGEIENASFIGDSSLFANLDKPGADLSALLDLVTSDAKVAFGAAAQNVTPGEIEKLLDDRNRSSELIAFAKLRLGEVIDKAIPILRQYKAGKAYVYTLDFEYVRDEKSKYPTPGRFSTKLLAKVTEIKKAPCIVIVYSGKYISIRVSRDLSGNIDMRGVIDDIKGNYAELVEAGGGHMLASGIKLLEKQETAKVVAKIVSLFKVQLGEGFKLS